MAEETLRKGRRQTGETGLPFPAPPGGQRHTGSVLFCRATVPQYQYTSVKNPLKDFFHLYVPNSCTVPYYCATQNVQWRIKIRKEFQKKSVFLRFLFRAPQCQDSPQFGVFLWHLSDVLENFILDLYRKDSLSFVYLHFYPELLAYINARFFPPYLWSWVVESHYPVGWSRLSLWVYQCTGYLPSILWM